MEINGIIYEILGEKKIATKRHHTEETRKMEINGIIYEILGEKKIATKRHHTEEIEMTEAQMNRLQRDWNKMAGEVVAIEKIGSTFYAFCSELAALRMFHKYNCDKARASFSKPRNSWFFSLETTL